MKHSLVLGLFMTALVTGCALFENFSHISLPSERQGGFEVVVIPNATQSPFPAAVAAGAFSGGRFPDFAISTWGNFLGETSGGINDGSLSVILGQNPSGRRFAPVDEYNAGRGAGSLAVADFNKDGKLDIAVAATNSQGGQDFRQAQQQAVQNLGEIQIFFGNGDGTFAPPRSIASPVPFPVAIAIGDINGDGHLDIVVGSKSATAGAIGLLLGRPDGQFNSYMLPVIGTESGSVAIGHFRDKRTADIVVLNRGETEDSEPSLSILLYEGTDRFTHHGFSLGRHRFSSVAVGDLTGDGRDDLVVHARDTLLIYAGDVAGRFSQLTKLPGAYALGQVRVADFDKDGNLDVLIPSSGLTFSILFGDGKGHFKSRVQLRAQFQPRISDGEAGHPLSLGRPMEANNKPQDLMLTIPWTTPEVADIDGDGYLDVAVPAVSAPFVTDYYLALKIPMGQMKSSGFLVLFLNRLHR